MLLHTAFTFNLYHSLSKFSRQPIEEISPKIGSDISLFPKETICIECQSLFSSKNKKNISKCQLKFLPKVLSIKVQIYETISGRIKEGNSLFVCVEVLRPSQPNGVMSSVVSLPNHVYWAGLVL